MSKMHLSSEIALDLIERQLAMDRQIFWRKHLEVCDECREDFGSWRQLVTDLKRSHLKSASDRVLHKVSSFYSSEIRANPASVA